MTKMKNILNVSDFNSRFKWKNDGFRTLYESAIHPYITTCLEDLKRYNKSNCVLIGGLAISYYLKPRVTQDIDLIFLSESEIPNDIHGFKRIRQHSFLHKNTHVEVEVLTPEFLKISDDMVKKVFSDSKEIDGIKVASPVSLIALKLDRFNDRDKLDIKELIQYCGENNIEIDLEEYKLSETSIEKFNTLINKSENVSNNMYYLETEFSLKNKEHKHIDVENFDVYIFKENYGEPRFHIFLKDDKTRYCLDLENMNIVDSTTDYKSFLLNESVGESINDYLKLNKNKIKEIYYDLNK